MGNVDKVRVKGEIYNVVSPSAFGDYIETIGGACTNPNGYAKDAIFLAKTNEVQNLYQATQAIAFGANIVVGTNCKQTTLDKVIRSMSGASTAADVSYSNTSSGLTATDAQAAIDEVNGKTNTNANNISSLNSALSNKADSSKAYQTDDATETTLASDDVLPFYDTSATAKRKMTVQKFGEHLISNPNLLDNPWFTVNQRGANSYSAIGYAVDRWYLWTNNASGTFSVSVNNDGIALSTDSNTTMNLSNRIAIDDFKNALGKTVTLSVLFGDGEVVTKTVQLPSVIYSSSAVGSITSHDIDVQLILNTTNYHSLTITPAKDGNAHVIKAVKLELGSVSTLAMDTAPNYATELLKCQRYFVRYLSPDNSGAVIGVGVYSANTNARITIPLPTNMRAKPSIVVSDLSMFKIVVDGETNTPTATQVSNIQNHLVAVNFTTPAVTNHLLATLNRTSQGAYIDFAADL